MATIEQIETWIAEAEAARPQVALGGAVIEVWRDGRRIKKSVTSMKELNAYLASLRSELAIAQEDAGIPATRTRRAIRLGWT